MVTCKEAHALIAHAVDGRIALAVFEPLRQHLAVCASCREALDTQRRVKAVLAARPSDSLSDGFAARLAARLDAEPRPHLTDAAPAASVKRPRRLTVASDGRAGAGRDSQTRDSQTDETRIAAADRPLVREMTLLASPSSGSVGWRNGAGWRTWAMRLLPAAAALVMLVDHDYFESHGRQDGPKPRSVVGSAAPTDERMLEWLARPSTTVDSLLVLGAKGAATTPSASASASQDAASIGSPDSRERAGGAVAAASSSSSSRGDAGSAASTQAAGGQVFAASSDRSAPSAPDRESAGAARGSADVRLADSRPSGDGRPGQGESAAGVGGSSRSAAVEDAARLANAWPAPTPMAAGAGSLPGTVVPNAVPTVLADRMAQDLRLTDAQRKKIEAIYDAQRQRLGEILEANRQRLTHERAETDEAVERVLTPRQRKRYRDMNANRGPALPISERAVPPGSSSAPQALPNGLEITITPAAPPPPFYR